MSTLAVKSNQDYVWNIDLFVKREIASKFVCVKCNDVPKQKCAFTNDKGEIYCEVCRQDDDNYNFNSPSLLLDNLIGTLSIYCPNSRAAKKEFIADGTDTDAKSDADIDAYCKWIGSINNYKIHIHQCDFIGVICPLQMIGCNANNMIQKDLPLHFNKYNIQHLIFMSQQLNQCTKTIKQLTDKITTLETKMNDIELSREQHKLDVIIDDLGDMTSDSDVEIYAIGYNYGGEFGLKNESLISQWRTLPVSSFGIIKKIYRSYQALFYLLQTGKLYCCGINGKGQLGLGMTAPTVDTAILNTHITEDIVLVSSGCAATHTFVMTQSGKLYGFGNNTCGQLGIEMKKRKRKKHKSHTGTHKKSNLLDEEKNINIYFDAGDEEKNVNRINYVFEPFEIPLGFKGSINEVQCGESHTLFLNGTDGTVWSCGSNKYGQCGLGTEVKGCVDGATQITALKHIFKIHCGQNFSICLDIDGALYSFGQNIMGQLGLGDNSKKNQALAVPAKIASFASGKIKIQNVKCGMNHVCCLDKQGRAYTFGCNKYGRCGVDREIKHLFSPRIVALQQLQEKNVKIVDIFCGNFHTILLSERNEYICFGSNNCVQCSVAQKELKEIDRAYKVTKKELGSNKSIIDIVCGFDTTLLIVDNKKVHI